MRTERFHFVRPFSVFFFFLNSIPHGRFFRRRKKGEHEDIFVEFRERSQAPAVSAHGELVHFGVRDFPPWTHFRQEICPVWLLDHGRRRRPLRRRLRAVRGHWEVSVTLKICSTPSSLQFILMEQDLMFSV